MATTKQVVQSQPFVQPKPHWRDVWIERAEAITDAWIVFKVWAGRGADWILFGCMGIQIFGMFVPLPDQFSKSVLGVQIFTLDIAGFGLSSLADQARENGNKRVAKNAKLTSWTLIGLMIITLGLLAAKSLYASNTAVVNFVNGSEPILVLVRIFMVVIYGHVVHGLHTKGQLSPRIQVQIDALNAERNELQSLLSARQEEFNGQRKELDTLKNRLSTLSTQLEAKQEKLDTLTVHLSTQQKQVDTLTGQVETLNIQLSSKQNEVDSGQRELEVQRRLVDSLSTELEKLKKQRNTGHKEGVIKNHVTKDSLKNAKVIQIQPRQPKGEAEIGEQIRELLAEEPGLSGRAIAKKLGCSPTTANKWKMSIETEQIAVGEI